MAIFIASPGAESRWLNSIGYTFIAAASAGLIGSTLRNGSPAFRLFHLKPLRVLGKYSYGFLRLSWAVDCGLGPAVGVCRDEAAFESAGNSAGDGGPTRWRRSLVAKLSYDLFEVRFLRFKKHFEYDSEVAERRHAFTTGKYSSECGF